MPPRSRERRALVSLGAIMAPSSVAALLAAIGTFWLAYDGGGYSLGSRGTAAIVVLWLLLLGAAAGLEAVRPPWPALAVGALLAALAFWTLLSTGWAASAEGAYAEFGRTLFYVAVFALVTVAATRANAGVRGRAASRPASSRSASSPSPRGSSRASSTRTTSRRCCRRRTRGSAGPVNYWNGLAVFVALGFPLLLRLAVASRSVLTRAVALAPLPVLASAIYLASSRGGALAAVAGTARLRRRRSTRRWRAAAAAALAAARGRSSRSRSSTAARRS